jgi:hypothetical protein
MIGKFAALIATHLECCPPLVKQEPSRLRKKLMAGQAIAADWKMRVRSINTA